MTDHEQREKNWQMAAEFANRVVTAIDNARAKSLNDDDRTELLEEWTDYFADTMNGDA